MRTLPSLSLFVILLVAVACAPLPTSPPTATLTPGTAPEEIPQASVTPASQGASAGWHTYVNPVSFSIQYPSHWTQTATSSSPPMYGVAVDGLQGGVELQWGEGFGGAYNAPMALRTAQGQLSTCYWVGDDGTHHWEQIYKMLPTAAFGSRAYTKDAAPASADLIHAVFATLTFGKALAAPTPQPAQGMEVVIDNGDAGFRPKENWHILPLLFHKSAQMVGKDCYQARPGLGASAEVLPDLPAEPITTHYHPTPLKQATSGDLAARLALVDPVFVSVPMTATQQIFDDCQTFPHEGCGGTRAGWLAIVTHQTISLTYRVTDDYKLLAVEGADLALDPWLMGQDTPQLVFLRGSGGGLNYTVHASQDNTWHLLRPGGGSLPDSDMTLTRDQAAILRSLAPKYSTLHLQPAGGGTFTFYGLGLTVAPTDAGRQALLALGAALMAAPP